MLFIFSFKPISSPLISQLFFLISMAAINAFDDCYILWDTSIISKEKALAKVFGTDKSTEQSDEGDWDIEKLALGWNQGIFLQGRMNIKALIPQIILALNEHHEGWDVELEVWRQSDNPALFAEQLPLAPVDEEDDGIYYLETIKRVEYYTRQSVVQVLKTRPGAKSVEISVKVVEKTLRCNRGIIGRRSKYVVNLVPLHHEFPLCIRYVAGSANSVLLDINKEEGERINGTNFHGPSLTIIHFNAKNKDINLTFRELRKLMMKHYPQVVIVTELRMVPQDVQLAMDFWSLTGCTFTSFGDGAIGFWAMWKEDMVSVVRKEDGENSFRAKFTAY